MPRLIVLDNTRSVRQVGMERWPFTVGRSPDCDLVLEHPQISRLHIVFEQVSGTMQVRDAGSNNGTLVNGRPLQSQTLHNGDELRLGPCTIRYLADGGTITPAHALKLVTIPGKLSELDMQKLAPRPRR